MQLVLAAEEWFFVVVQWAILLLEAIGVCVLVYTAVKSVIDMFRKSGNIRLNLAEGIGLALEFKLGSEVLRTLIVREWKELAILGAIVLLRAAITFLIHWEIKMEKKNLNDEEHGAQV